MDTAWGGLSQGWYHYCCVILIKINVDVIVNYNISRSGNVMRLRTMQIFLRVIKIRRVV
jgi:hypothetical protein